MDLIKISDTKLKIMLNCEDMAHYDLHNDHISIADRHVRHVLRQILADAKQQTGFDSDMQRLYVQMYPSADGGCELFVSKPEADNDIPAACTDVRALSITPQYGRALSAKERLGNDMCAYSFTCLEHLIAVCRRLDSIGYHGASSAFVDQKHTYFLILNEVSHPSLYSPDEYCFLGEYGNRENARALQSYLGEYCRQICAQNAVQTLMQL